MEMAEIWGSFHFPISVTLRAGRQSHPFCQEKEWHSSGAVARARLRWTKLGTVLSNISIWFQLFHYKMLYNVSGSDILT